MGVLVSPLVAVAEPFLVLLEGAGTVVVRHLGVVISPVNVGLHKKESKRSLKD